MHLNLSNVGGSSTHHMRLNLSDEGSVEQKMQMASNLPNVASAVVKERLAMLEDSLHDDPILQRLKLSKEKMEARFRKFKTNFESEGGAADNSLNYRIRQLAASKDSKALELELKYAFYGAVVSSSVRVNDQEFQEKLLNLKHPSEWYPRTRGIQRTFHIHVGPTNSGKTYHALKRLEQANSGVYAGPLRLLAHEVYMRLNARGKLCNLVTGDERKLHENPLRNAKITSSTVEMLSLNDVFDVAVIDEVQMIGSEDRGWAWTQAILGVMAREVHVCGEERAVPIIEELAAACGETVKVHRYERLSPLEMMPRSLRGDLSLLRKGDCIVGFSIVVLHSLRQYIERETKRKCAIIYGSLPPETRTQQAQLFNDPDNDYDYLVASNAVGMGLNLSIKRLIFQSAHRNIKGRLEAVPVPEIKQIAGRAGRYSTASQDMKGSATSVDVPLSDKPPLSRTESVQQIDSLSVEQHSGGVQQEASTCAIQSQDLVIAKSADQTNSSAPESSEGTRVEVETHAIDNKPSTQDTRSSETGKSLGLVTTLERLDYSVVAKAMRTDPLPLISAAVLPPTNVIERFSRYYPVGTPLAFLLLRLKEIASTNRRFFHCDIKTQVGIADAIESVSGLTIRDRLEFCAAPIDARRAGEPELARAYATMVGGPRPGSVLDVQELDIELLEDDYKADKEYLKKLEGLHKGLIIFNWLSFRFTGIFLNQPLATHVKELAEKRIEETLENLSFNYLKMRKSRDQALLDMLEDTEESVESNEAVRGSTKPHSQDGTVGDTPRSADDHKEVGRSSDVRQSDQETRNLSIPIDVVKGFDTQRHAER
ncbi:MAG: hypothetical protein Q9162_001127 [Coniocarpon cinnabarinum]